jgi:hypothetical protein
MVNTDLLRRFAPVSANRGLIARHRRVADPALANQVLNAQADQGD